MTNRKALIEINHLAIQVLMRELGAVNTLRFVRQFSNGYGNYTEERKESFKNSSLDEMIDEIKSLRKTGHRDSE